MKIDEIKTIVKMMSDHDLTEFKIQADGFNLCIRRGSNGNSAPILVQTPVVPAPAPTPTPVSTSEIATPLPVTPTAEPATPRCTIDSPLVGTFYRAGSPDATPFVKVGDTVSADTVIGIIEAMKVMNEVKAEKSGVIKEVLVENGQPVEFGQPLFVIE